jgi:hypothetical protein
MVATGSPQGETSWLTEEEIVKRATNLWSDQPSVEGDGWPYDLDGRNGAGMPITTDMIRQLWRCHVMSTKSHGITVRWHTNPREKTYRGDRRYSGMPEWWGDVENWDDERVTVDVAQDCIAKDVLMWDSAMDAEFEEWKQRLEHGYAAALLTVDRNDKYSTDIFARFALHVNNGLLHPSWRARTWENVPCEYRIHGSCTTAGI